jgi:hypothetical protein
LISCLSGHFDVKGPAGAQNTATLDFFKLKPTLENSFGFLISKAYFLAVKASEAYLVICLLPFP